MYFVLYFCIFVVLYFWKIFRNFCEQFWWVLVCHNCGLLAWCAVGPSNLRTPKSGILWNQKFSRGEGGWGCDFFKKILCN